MTQVARRYHVVHLTEEVHGRLKSAAADRGLTMGDFIVALLDGGLRATIVPKRQLETNHIPPDNHTVPPWERPPFWANRPKPR